MHQSLQPAVVFCFRGNLLHAITEESFGSSRGAKSIQAYFIEVLPLHKQIFIGRDLDVINIHLLLLLSTKYL